MSTPVGSVRYLEIGAKVVWVSDSGLSGDVVGTILPDPNTNRAYPLDPEGFECPELRWVQFPDEDDADLVSIDNLTTEF